MILNMCVCGAGKLQKTECLLPLGFLRIKKIIGGIAYLYEITRPGTLVFSLKP